MCADGKTQLSCLRSQHDKNIKNVGSVNGAPARYHFEHPREDMGWTVQFESGKLSCVRSFRVCYF